MRTDVSVDSKQQHLQGIAFPIEEEALEAMRSFKDGKIDYIQLVSTILKCEPVHSFIHKIKHLPIGNQNWVFFFFFWHQEIYGENWSLFVGFPSL